MFTSTDQFLSYIYEHIAENTTEHQMLDTDTNPVIKLNSGLKINTRVISEIYSTKTNIVLSQNTSSFVCPIPKNGMDKTDFLVLMLASIDYTFNPLTYHEPRWTDSNFQSAWSLVNRIYINDNSLKFLYLAINSRNEVSYCNSRGECMYLQHDISIQCMDPDVIKQAIGSSTEVFTDESLNGKYESMISLVCKQLLQ